MNVAGSRFCVSAVAAQKITSIDIPFGYDIHLKSQKAK